MTKHESNSPAAAPAGSPNAGSAARYQGKPMLIVIDNYALSVIGVLAPDKETSIKKIVQQTFGGGDDWRATVRKTMGWPVNVDDEIRMNWADFTEKARLHSVAADPVVFAQAFGDEFSKY